MAEETPNNKRPYDSDLDPEIFEERGWQPLVKPVETYRKMVAHAKETKEALLTKGKESKEKVGKSAKSEVMTQIMEEGLEKNIEEMIDEVIFPIFQNDPTPAEYNVIAAVLGYWAEHLAYLGGLELERRIAAYKKANPDAAADEEELAEIREDFDRTVATARSLFLMFNFFPGIKTEDKAELEYPTLNAVGYGLSTAKNKSKYPVDTYQHTWTITRGLEVDSEVIQVGAMSTTEFVVEHLLPVLGVRGRGITVEDVIAKLTEENENWKKPEEITMIEISDVLVEVSNLKKS